MAQPSSGHLPTASLPPAQQQQHAAQPLPQSLLPPQQQQQQAVAPPQPAVQPAAAAVKPQVLTTAKIQQHLDENAAWIKAIIDNTALGRVDQATQYQQKLQTSLMYLASVADAQPQAVTAVVPAPAAAVAQPTAQLQQR